jgi:Glu-tRNA(Gln) amidotransferase subunit E-like FAD-binding protein
LALLAFEFWCCLGDEEVQRFKNQISKQSNTLITNSNPVENIQKLNKKYFSTYYPQLVEIIMQFIYPSVEDEEEDSSNWTLSKASLYVLYILVQVIDNSKMEKIVKYIDNNLSSSDLKIKNISLLLFTGCSNTLPHKSKVNDLINKHLNKIIELLFNESLVIKKSASLLMIKITNIMVKVEYSIHIS